MNSPTDSIQTSVLIQAPRARVWRALTDPQEFGAWFGMKLDGDTFQAGRPIVGQITIPQYAHVRMALHIERVDPQSVFAWRWHPGAIDTSVDYSAEPLTLVELTLSEEGAATRVSVRESGFDALPAARRESALRMNTSGWDGQMRNIVRYLTP